MGAWKLGMAGEQAAYVEHFDLAFKELANPSKTVHFVNFAFWMGRMREASHGPLLEQMESDFASGRWAAATNFSELWFTDRVRVDDRVVGELRLLPFDRPQRTTLRLSLQWTAQARGKEPRSVAHAVQNSSWVELPPGGSPRFAPYPDYFTDFHTRLLPANGVQGASHRPFSFADWAGKAYVSLPAGPLSPHSRIHESRFSTSYVESNVVGNVYFATYFAWQAHVRDAFFHALGRELFGRTPAAEWFCLRARVDHLRELFPFEPVLVFMHLRSIHPHGVSLAFEYFGLGEDGSRHKVAIGEQDVVWCEASAQAGIEPMELPDPMRRLMDRIKQVNAG